VRSPIVPEFTSLSVQARHTISHLSSRVTGPNGSGKAFHNYPAQQGGVNPFRGIPEVLKGRKEAKRAGEGDRGDGRRRERNVRTRQCDWRRERDPTIGLGGLCDVMQIYFLWAKSIAT